nr:MAG TPA: hypothetical protein [Caudoviricetes sp.]
MKICHFLIYIFKNLPLPLRFICLHFGNSLEEDTVRLGLRFISFNLSLIVGRWECC